MGGLGIMETCAHVLRQAPDSADDADEDAKNTPPKLPIWQEARVAIMKVSGLFGHAGADKEEEEDNSGRSIAWDGTLDIRNLIIACEYMSSSQ